MVNENTAACENYTSVTVQDSPALSEIAGRTVRSRSLQFQHDTRRCLGPGTAQIYGVANDPPPPSSSQDNYCTTRRSWRLEDHVQVEDIRQCSGYRLSACKTSKVSVILTSNKNAPLYVVSLNALSVVHKIWQISSFVSALFSQYIS